MRREDQKQSESDIQVAYVERVFLYEEPARLDQVAHQLGEHLFRLLLRTDADFQQRTHLGIHRGGPQLLRVHLPQPLVTLDLHALLTRLQHRLRDRLERGHRVLIVAALDRIGRRIGFQFGGQPADLAQLAGMKQVEIDHRRWRGAVANVEEDRLEMRFPVRVDLVVNVGVRNRSAQRLGGFLHPFAALKAFRSDLLRRGQLGHRADHVALLGAALQRLEHPIVIQRPARQGLKRRAFDFARLLALAEAYRNRLASEVGQVILQRCLVLEIALLLALFGAKQRGLRDVEIAIFDYFGELAEEKSQQQRTDMGAVHIGVGHDDDAVVAQLLDILLAAHTHSQGRDQRAQLGRGQDLVDPGPLDVQDLAAQRQDRLRAPVAPLLGGAAGRLAFDQEQFAARGVALLAVRQLARQRGRIQRALAPHQLLGLARRLPRGGSFHRARHDSLRVAGVFFQVLPQLFVDHGNDDAFDFGVAQLGLGLTLELRLADLHADDRGQSLTRIIAFQPQILVLDQVVFSGVGVNRAGQRRTQTRNMRPAFDRVDIVGVAEDAFMNRVGPLQGAIDVDPVAHRMEVDHVMQRFAALVEDLDEFADSAFEMELLALAVALVGEPDAQAAVEIRHLAQIARDQLVLELDLGKNFRVGRKRGFGPGLLCAALLFDLGLGDAALVALVIDLAAAMDLGFKLFAQRVDDRGAHAVQTARHLVNAAIELAARVQNRVHDFQCRALLRRMHIDGDAAAVIFNRDPIVAMNDDVDFIAEAGQCLVHRVVDDFNHQVMESALGGIADIHARTLAYRFEPLQDSDRLSPVRFTRLLVAHRGETSTTTTN